MSFDQDPREQANISGADFAFMCDEFKRLKAINAELLKACLSVIEYNEAEHDDSVKMMIDYADSLALCRAAVASATTSATTSATASLNGEIK